MQNKPKAILIMCLAVMVFSCAGLTKDQATQWLDGKMGEPGMNMTGKWDSGGVISGGWGAATFIQTGNRFSGSLGMYYAEGVVVGNELYMTISSGRKVYYTAYLKKSTDGTISGKAVEKVIIDRPEAEKAARYLIELKKVQE